MMAIGGVPPTHHLTIHFTIIFFESIKLSISSIGLWILFYFKLTEIVQSGKCSTIPPYTPLIDHKQSLLHSEYLFNQTVNWAIKKDVCLIV